MTKSRLIDDLEAAERERAELLALLEGRAIDVLRRSPGGDAWSALQVVSHLVQAESLSLESIRKRLPQGEDLAPAGIGGRFRSLLLKVVLRSGWKVRAPKVVSVPPEHVNLGEARSEWEDVRAGWRRLIEEYPEAWEDRAIYTHPRVGRLNLAQALDFLREHVRHHRPQVERTLAAVQS